MKQLSDILKHGGNSPAARMQAGLQLKNALYSKDSALQTQHQQRWLQFPDDIKNYIKKNVSTFCSRLDLPRGGTVIFMSPVLETRTQNIYLWLSCNIPNSINI